MRCSFCGGLDLHGTHHPAAHDAAAVCVRCLAAIEAGLRSVRLRPNDQLAWSSLSLFYVRNNQVPEAEAAGAKAKILSWGGRVNPDAIPPANSNA